MELRRAAGALVVAAIALAAASAAYQAAGEARDRRRHPPGGRLVDVGGYRLHVVCAGEGIPPVVICPAIGATTEAWRDVQRMAAEETSACVYDRAGLGYSDSPPRRRTAVRMAEELHELLHSAGIGPPYVLAGHSMGGLVVRVFARLYPDEVAGLALIDSSHPEQHKRLPRTSLRDYPGGMMATAALDWARPLGLRRLARDLGLIEAPLVESHRNRRADAAEMLAFSRIRRETGEMTGALGDLPLAVLTSARIDPAYLATRQRRRDRFYKAWAVMQDEMEELSTDSTHVVANYGGHHLNRQNPELVAQVIASLVRRIRDASSG